MKSITIHNLDKTLDMKIRERARKSGLSLNKTIQSVLRESFGLSSGPSPDHSADFDEFLGVWSKHDADSFAKNNSSFSKIDESDWH